MTPSDGNGETVRVARRRVAVLPKDDHLHPVEGGVLQGREDLVFGGEHLVASTLIGETGLQIRPVGLANLDSQQVIPRLHDRVTHSRTPHSLKAPSSTSGTVHAALRSSESRRLGVGRSTARTSARCALLTRPDLRGTSTHAVILLRGMGDVVIFMTDRSIARQTPLAAVPCTRNRGHLVARVKSNAEPLRAPRVCADTVPRRRNCRTGRTTSEVAADRWYAASPPRQQCVTGCRRGGCPRPPLECSGPRGQG